ncbi:hypothetical protein TREES_T100010456 [Tupaia chinensis]|uniref:Uncharacterized protein n=1 Tax=Tupaia chinensis TaxID=246437 RepID=L9LAB1_TUPCH|nr:hypothetical protein TREES_T100010456 [Tupaia chinensis]
MGQSNPFCPTEGCAEIPDELKPSNLGLHPSSCMVPRNTAPDTAVASCCRDQEEFSGEEKALVVLSEPLQRHLSRL